VRRRLARHRPRLHEVADHEQSAHRMGAGVGGHRGEAVERRRVAGEAEVEQRQRAVGRLAGEAQRVRLRAIRHVTAAEDGANAG
jgi:hypothetical protein